MIIMSQLLFLKKEVIKKCIRELKRTRVSDGNDSGKLPVISSCAGYRISSVAFSVKC